MSMLPRGLPVNLSARQWLHLIRHRDPGIASLHRAVGRWRAGGSRGPTLARRRATGVRLRSGRPLRRAWQLRWPSRLY